MTEDIPHNLLEDFPAGQARALIYERLLSVPIPTRQFNTRPASRSNTRLPSAIGFFAELDYQKSRHPFVRSMVMSTSICWS